MTDIAKTHNMTVKGTVASAAVGAGAGFGAYKLLYGLGESFAKDGVALKEDEFVKDAVLKQETSYRQSAKALGANDESIEKFVKNITGSWTESAKKSYLDGVENCKKVLSSCKKAKIGFIAGATVLGVGIYKLVKVIKNRNKSDVQPEVKPETEAKV